MLYPLYYDALEANTADALGEETRVSVVPNVCGANGTTSFTLNFTRVLRPSVIEVAKLLEQSGGRKKHVSSVFLLLLGNARR